MLFLPDGSQYRAEKEDSYLLGIVWRGSNVLIMTNRPLIQRLEHEDKRRVAEQLRKIFEADFGPNIYL